MRRIVRCALVVAAGCCTVACDGSKNLSGAGGSATGGTLDAGGIPPGSGGSGGGSDGAAGTGGASDGPICASPGGPLTTWDRPRPTFPWTLTSANGDGGFSGTASASGCHVVAGTYEPDILCSGLATLRAGTAGPTLFWDDGAQLTWDPTGLAQPFGPPIAAGAADQRVWAELERRSVSVCAFCGSYETRTMDIRESQSGAILFMARQGVRLDDLTQGQVRDVFGAGSSSVATCTFQTQAGCNVFRRTNADHLLNTLPAQPIPHAVPTRVITANGTFDVIWHASSDVAVGFVNNCADGPGIADDTGFVASRVSGVRLYDQP